MAITRNSDFAAGVKNRILEIRRPGRSSQFRSFPEYFQIIGRVALALQRLVELAVQSRQLFVERLQLLLDVTSSSLVDCASSFRDIACSLMRFCSSFALSRS